MNTTGRPCRSYVLLGVVAAAACGAGAKVVEAQDLPPAATRQVDYLRDVQPILRQHCYSCHGSKVQQAGLRLDQRQNALRGGDYGPVIVPGRSAESKLIRRLVNGDGGLQMPPTGALEQDDISLLRAWIDQGPEFVVDLQAEMPPPPVHPRLAQLLTAVRSGAWRDVEKILAASPELLGARDAGGSTPLHHAAGFGTLETLRGLLDAGADVKATNERASTPLHWAIPDAAKVRLLLSRGAPVNARQVEGRTPLYLAAQLGQGRAVVPLLLEHGADPALASVNGQSPLMVAAARGHAETLRVLLDHKADVNARNSAGDTPLILAAGSGHHEAVRLLIERGADARARSKRNETALGSAATAGVEDTVRLLLAQGAEVNVRNVRGFSPLMLAANSDTVPTGAVKLLLAHGADLAFTADYDESARDLARKRGDTEVARLLGAAPNPPPAAIPAVSHAVAPASLTTAVDKALALLARQSETFIRVGGCNSCHSQDLPSAAAALARSRGVGRSFEVPQLPRAMEPPAERLMDLNAINPGSIGWELFDLALNGAPGDAYTDAAVHYLKAMQTPEGHWSAAESRRPPMNDGDYQFTALAIFAVQRYTPVAHRASSDEALARAAAWLERSTPALTQDRAFQALGLEWARPGSAAARRTALRLLELQREDGGWSQLPGLASDAYATGQALYALATTGAAGADAPAVRKGLNYLLRTQAADGSWQVKSRAIWFQPYFESGFPYGQDQFISTAGTAWAVMALTSAAPPHQTTVTSRGRR